MSGDEQRKNVSILSNILFSFYKVGCEDRVLWRRKKYLGGMPSVIENFCLCIDAFKIDQSVLIGNLHMP